jgi:hypothetical protein
MDSTPSTRTAPYARPDQPHPPARGGDVSLGTLAIAAAASAVAAFVTSQVWAGGTLVSAALSPVIVALVKEGLARPAEKVKTVRLVRGTRGEPVEAAGDERPIPAGVAYEAEELTPVTVYGRSERRRPRFTRKQLRIAFITGLLAFGIVVVIYTVPELLSGSSIGGGGSSRTTLFGGTPAAQKKASSTKPSASATPTATPRAGTTPTATPAATVTATPTAAATASATPAAPAATAAPTTTTAPAPTP